MGRTRTSSIQRRPLNETSCNINHIDTRHQVKHTWQQQSISESPSASTDLWASTTSTQQLPQPDALNWISKTIWAFRGSKPQTGPTQVAAPALQHPCAVNFKGAPAHSGYNNGAHEIGARFAAPTATTPEKHQTSFTVSKYQPMPISVSTHRMVVLAARPSVSLHCLLSQVHGGPVEKVRVRNGLVFIRFVHGAMAESFYTYAKSGRFVAAGKVMYPEVMPENISTTPARRTPEFEQCLADGARRILRLYRYTATSEVDNINNRKAPGARSEISQVTLPNKMNLLELRQTFSETGEVLLVKPAIVRNQVAFNIHYADIPSAINAKRLFDCRYSVFANFKGWKIDYAPDPCDRPCIFI